MMDPNTGTYFQTGPLENLPAMHTRMDEYMAIHHPDKVWVSSPPEHIEVYLRMHGATDDTLWECLDRYNQACDALLSRPDSMHIYGEKPRPERDDIWLIPIPDSHLDIRAWRGGMEMLGGFFLDFYDPVQRQTVNTPCGYELWDVPRAGMIPLGMLRSVEELFVLQREWIKEGEEKFTAAESQRLVLRRCGKPDFYFELPAIPLQTGGVPLPRLQLQPRALEVARL